MSTIADFNRIEDCNKIDPLCIDAYADFDFDADNEAGLCFHTPWGGACLDLTDLVRAAETCTTLYLSPEDNPNCLVYEPECGDNICIHGDDLSKIISMKHLKDVGGEAPFDGVVYMYNGTTGQFEPFDLKTILGNISTNFENMNATINGFNSRLTRIESALTPPAGAPDNARVVFGNINEYSDPDVVISEGSGTVTTLDKTHGFYSHSLSDNAYGDEIFG